ncbi:MAG: cbb3-type cytochrome c oxidase N-terminal domain-containing protein [Saprospiraceae bacterium]
MKKLFLLTIGLGVSYGAFAQDVAQNSATDPYLFQKIMTTSIFIIGGIVILAAVLTLLRLSESMSNSIVKQYLAEQGKEGETALETVKAPKKPSWIQRLTAAVPVEHQEEIVFDHAFDGIRELDNKLPPWWVGMFYITIVIAVGYFFYYEVLEIGDNTFVQYKKEMAQAEEAKKARLASLGSQIDESNVKQLTDADAIAAGQAEFVAKCAACHLADGGGSVGPNLTDKYWLHGGSIQDVFKTIKYGVPSKGMIAWESQLTPIQMQNVASFILSLQGTTPTTAKDPQGELYIAEATETTDSTATTPEPEDEEATEPEGETEM